MMKALLLVIVLGAVWYLWKTITEQKAAAEAKPEEPDVPSAEAAAATAECPLCRNFVAIDAEGGCGREDCPIPELAAAAAGEATPEDAPGTAEPPRPGEPPKP